MLPQLVTLADVQTLFPSQGIDAKEFINAFLVSTAIEETITSTPIICQLTN